MYVASISIFMTIFGDVGGILVYIHDISGLSQHRSKADDPELEPKIYQPQKVLAHEDAIWYPQI